LCHLQQKLLHIRPWRDNGSEDAAV
jgi:hypothetical protein